MCAPEIFDGCPLDIGWVSWRYLMGVLEILICVLEIFLQCPADIGWVSW